MIERCVEKAGWGCWEFYVLTRIPKERVDWKRCPEPKGYGLWGPLARSLLIPGWGQSYKGEKGKAKVFRVSEGISAGIAMVSYLMARYEEDQVVTSRSRIRSSEGELWRIVAWVTGGLGVLIHVYNVVDAITAPGVKRYADAQQTEQGMLAFSVKKDLCRVDYRIIF